MNARILELAKKSGIDIYGLGKDREKWQRCLEQFAGLIAAEYNELYLIEEKTMNHEKIYNELYQDFGPVIALSVCQVNAINLTMKVKKRDWESGSFNRTDRVIKKAEKLLYELDEHNFNLIIALWKEINEWQVGQDMDGLGGCEKKTFLELLQKKGYVN